MSTAQAGMAWSDIAASAYRAYGSSTGNKNFRGDPMPEWEQLPQPIRVAWEAAARQVGDCTRRDPGAAPPDERRWAGWLPPHLKQGRLCMSEGTREPETAGHWCESTDAYLWADKWLERHAAEPGIAADRDTMMGWFANAIMAGYDGAKRGGPGPTLEDSSA